MIYKVFIVQQIGVHRSIMSLVLLLLLLIASSVNSHEIIITDQYQLEDLLCNGTNQLVEDTVVVLATNITHFIGNVSLCIINTTYSFMITTNSLETALVHCNDSTHEPYSGFAFINVRNLTLHRLVFIGCGGYLRGSVVMDYLNSNASTANFSLCHSAVFIFIHVNTLVIKEVNVTQYYGFAVLAVTPMNSVLDNIVISSSRGSKFSLISKHSYCSMGSGILFLFRDYQYENIYKLDHPNVTIQHASFQDNFEYIKHFGCLYDLQGSLIPIVNAAGLTTIFTQSYTANVYVKHTEFSGNNGSLTGGLLILHYNSVSLSRTTLLKTQFSMNFNLKPCRGADLSLFVHFDKDDNIFPCSNESSTFLSVVYTNFTEHKSIRKNSYGIINIFINSMRNIRINFTNVYFNEIYSAVSGTCMHVSAYRYHYFFYDAGNFDYTRSKNIDLVLSNITENSSYQYSAFTNPSKSGIFTIKVISSVILKDSIFANNVGSVFEISDSDLVLAGNLLFTNNYGEVGSVFNIIGTGRIYLQKGLDAQFINNSAVMAGGAIYAYDTLSNKCMFIPLASNTTDISMKFINNNANDFGSSVFSTRLYHCLLNEIYYNTTKAKAYIRAISNGSLDNGLSTLPQSFCVCSDENCTVSSGFSNAIAVYPGMKLQILMTALDGFNQTAYTDISLTLMNMNNILHFVPFSSWTISNSRQVLLNRNCTPITLFFFKMDHKMNPKRPHIAVTSIPDALSSFFIKIVLKDCPIGFEFSVISQKCECSSVFQKLGYEPNCTISSDGVITTFTISLSNSTSGWIGLLEKSNISKFGLSHHCKYCAYDITFIKFNDIQLKTGNKQIYAQNLCPKHRSGTLCSQCITDHSVVFGSYYDCCKCSNWWLLTLVVYGIAGPLLIYLLYALNLTLTSGALNSIIFYAQMVYIVQYNVHVLKTQQNSLNYSVLVRGLISLINLNIDFKFPLCLYDGMTELLKSGLSLLFPIYLLTIVIVLIIISRYSVRLSNRIADSSVQVLVTVVHLSFSTLLASTLNVFTPVYIYTNTSGVPLKVWQNDGTVEYGKDGHLILMIVTGVVVGPILITYLTVLLAGRPLMKINKVREYLRPIYEAIHAPYKHNKEFFFSFTIILVIFLYLLNDMFAGSSPIEGLMFGIPVSVFFFTIGGSLHPFKQRILNVLNTFIFSTIGILASTVWYCYISSLVTFITILFCCDTVVIITLILIILLRLPFVKRYLRKAKFRKPTVSQGPDDSHHNNRQPPFHSSSFFESCQEREPLLRYS